MPVDILHIQLYTHHTLFTHSYMEGHLGDYDLLVLVNIAAWYICVQIFEHLFTILRGMEYR